MAYNFTDLKRRTYSDKVLKDKALKIASDPKYNGYERGFASMVYNFFENKSKGSGILNQQIANDLHKPIIKKFKRRKVYSSYKDNIWGFDLAYMDLISKYNKGIKYLFCVIDLFSKYDWVVPLKDKKSMSIINAFQSILKSSNEFHSKRKPNKIWVNQGSEFYKNKFKNWLKDNDISMYSTFNEGKSVIAARFIKTLKTKLYKHMTSISKNAYYDVLDDIRKKYNNTFHSTIKMKPIEVENGSFTEYNKETNKKDPRFKVGDYVRISKHKNIFAKGYTPNWSEEIFILKK